MLLVLALVLGTGQPMPAAGEAQVGTAASMIMGGMASNAVKSSMCEKCTDKGATTLACFAGCVGVQGVLPATTILRLSTLVALAPLMERQLGDTIAAPDSPPPKPGVFA